MEIGGVANGQERRKGRSAEENRSRKSGAAHRRPGTGSRESPERVPRRSAVEGRGGDPQERPQFTHTPTSLGEGRLARHAPGHREWARNDRRRRPEGGPVHRGDRKNSGDVSEGLMKNLSISAAILLAATLGTCGASAQSQADKPAVVRLDPALDAPVSPDARLQLVKGGFGFTEGLIWVAKGRYLLLSDIPANVIYKLTPQGEASIYMHRSGYTQPDIWRVGFEQTNGKNPDDPLFEKFYMIGSNGLALDRQGRLIIATWAGRSIDRIEKNGKRTVLADRFEGRQFNGPNDVIVKRNGTIYFTDTYGGLRLRERDPRKGLDFQGVYMIKD